METVLFIAFKELRAARKSVVNRSYEHLFFVENSITVSELDTVRERLVRRRDPLTNIITAHVEP